MIVQRKEAEEKVQLDYSVIEDSMYPATFFKVVDGVSVNGAYLRWIFKVDEVNNIPIYVSLLTPTDLQPGKKLDSLLRTMGFDVDSWDGNTDNIAQDAYKIMLFCEKKEDKNNVLRFNATKWKTYVEGARGTEPLEYPHDYYLQQQAQLKAAPAAAPVAQVHVQQRAPFVAPIARPQFQGAAPITRPGIVVKPIVRSTSAANVTNVETIDYTNTANGKV